MLRLVLVQGVCQGAAFSATNNDKDYCTSDCWIPTFQKRMSTMSTTDLDPPKSYYLSCPNISQMSEVGGSSSRVREKPDPGPASCGGAVVLLLATTTADWRPFTRVWWCAAQHRYIMAAALCNHTTYTTANSPAVDSGYLFIYLY